MAHLGHGAIAVISHHFHQHRDTTGRVTFIGQLLHVIGFVGAGAASNGAIDGVAGHIGAQRLVHRRAQPRVILWQGAALLGGDDQLANELGEHLAALGILGRLAVLDIGPFTVTGHRSSLYI